MEKNDYSTKENEREEKLNEEFKFVYSRMDGKNPLTTFKIAFEPCVGDNQIGFPNSQE